MVERNYKSSMSKNPYKLTIYCLKMRTLCSEVKLVGTSCTSTGGQEQSSCSQTCFVIKFLQCLSKPIVISLLKLFTQVVKKFPTHILWGTVRYMSVAMLVVLLQETSCYQLLFLTNGEQPIIQDAPCLISTLAT